MGIMMSLRSISTISQRIGVTTHLPLRWGLWLCFMAIMLTGCINDDDTDNQGSIVNIGDAVRLP